jgi:hypothetical protein
MSTPSGPNPIPQPGKNPPNPPPQPAVIKVPSSTNPLVAWLKDHSITSHSVAVGLVSAATLIASDEQVRSFLVGLFSAHPKIATSIIALSGIILKYSRSTTTSGAAANVAQDVKPETLP